MDAEYKMQEEKIKNQQKLLSVQEKYTRALGKNPPNQSPILINQLKRLNKKINNLKIASSVPPPPQPKPVSAPSEEAPKPVNTGITMPSQNSAIQAREGQKKFEGMPHTGVVPAQRTQQQWDEISKWKRNRVLSDPKNKEIENKVMSAPTGVPSYASGVKEEISSYWQDPKKYMAHNNPFGKGLGGSVANFLGDFTTDINSGFSNLAKGNLAQGVGDLVGGYAGGALTLGTGGTLPTIGKGLAWGAGKMGLKGLASSGAKSVGKTGLKGFLPSVAKNVGLLGLTQLSTAYDPQSDEEQATENEEWNNSWNNEGSPGMGGTPLASGQQAPGDFSAQQQQQSPYTSMTPSQRFSAMNQQALNSMYANSPNMYKVAGDYYKEVTEGLAPEDAKATIDFMKNQKEKGLYSPLPILQRTSYLKPQEFKNDIFNPSGQQGYGPVGDFIKKLIFSFVPGLSPQPDWQRVHGNLSNNQAHRIGGRPTVGAQMPASVVNNMQTPSYLTSDFN
jgi:hypothetical protein